MSIKSLLHFRKNLEFIKETGDLKHDAYLQDLKKLIDEEMTKPKPNIVKVMNFMCMNRMKFDLGM
jgi:hypothetical protein